jgi:hypothetical protein
VTISSQLRQQIITVANNRFNPRIQAWKQHFVWDNNGTLITGLTNIGRATVITLRLNNENIVEARTFWVEVGWHPPTEMI